jgi:putative aldouronate transport system substrate-binding protein
MELITYLNTDEGNMVEYFGREGVDYTLVDGKPVQNKEITDLYKSDPTAYQVKYGFGEIYMLNNTSFISRVSGIEQFIPALQQPKQFTVDYIKPVNEDFNKDRYLTSEDQRNNERIKTQWCQTFSKILTAQSDAEVDQFMKEYTDFRDANGYDKITEAENKAIAENIAKLN